MDDYKQYLAQHILTEDKLVTYRSLSRALKVNVNTAKEMLYDFHKWQNDRRPGTLHATYLVYGTQKKQPEQAERDEDVEMADSTSEVGPQFSDEVLTHTLTLTEEEQLQDVLKQYEEVASIHVYSLAPHPLKDLQILADTAHDVIKTALAEESSEAGKVYGAVTNSNVWKRQRKGGAPKPAPAAPTPAIKTAPKVKEEPKPAVKEESKPAQPASSKEAKAPAATAAKKVAAAPGFKRQGSSGGISQMFAKAAAKPKRLASSATSNTPSAAEEEAPALSDEGEDDSDMPDAKPDPEAGKARKNRQAELRRMMEESDEEEPEPEEEAPADEIMDDEPPPPELEPEAKEEPAEIISSTGDGRKRGRRRVTKKKQIMDDQGYLVTIQEQGWESFSEDEAPPAPAPTQKSEKPAAAAPAAKAKKAAAKGQGNIMSFFSKK